MNYYLTLQYHHSLLFSLLIILLPILLIFKFYYSFIFILLLFIFLQYFYRLPKDIINKYTFKNQIVAASFGTVHDITESVNHYRISTFLNVFDVHYQYFPISGYVMKRLYQPGSFYPAFIGEKTKYNERCNTLIQSRDGSIIEVIQIAGLLARRIDTFYQKDIIYNKSDLLGIIHFGSRVDVIIPKKIQNKEVIISVKKGQKLIGGQTPIAYY
jgi:phosphatidylserine decarboxylase